MAEKNAQAFDAAKVVQAADAIEVRILKNIQGRLEAGKPVGQGELKALRKIREKYEQQASGPDASPELASRPGLAPVLLAWKPLAEVAGMIGVTERWLRKWIKGEAKCKPKLPSRKVSGTECIQAVVAYEHILAHAAKGSPTMHAPAGYVAAAAPGAAPVLPSFKTSNDPMELLTNLLDRETLLTIKPELMGKLTNVAREIWRMKNDDEKRKAMLTPEQYLEALRKFVAVFIAVVHDRASVEARAVLKFLNERYSVDLERSAPEAPSVLEDLLRQLDQEKLNALQRELDAQCEGVRLLEASA